VLHPTRAAILSVYQIQATSPDIVIHPEFITPLHLWRQCNLLKTIDTVSDVLSTYRRILLTIAGVEGLASTELPWISNIDPSSLHQKVFSFKCLRHDVSKLLSGTDLLHHCTFPFLQVFSSCEMLHSKMLQLRRDGISFTHIFGTFVVLVNDNLRKNVFNLQHQLIQERGFSSTGSRSDDFTLSRRIRCAVLPLTPAHKHSTIVKKHNSRLAPSI
jgi:hypothetical protein